VLGGRVADGLAVADPVASGNWHLHRLTERRPYDFGHHAILEGVAGAAVPQRGENEVADQGSTLGVAKFISDGEMKLASGH
jgi:hypothetical protein